MEDLVMNLDLKSFFTGKKIFITGHTGFKGSWLSFWLNELGAQVTGYALEPDYDHSLFESVKLADRINHIVGDVRDYEKLSQSLLDSKAEFVFHLAAQALVRRSYQEPLLTFSTNVMGSVNLLEAVRVSPTVRSLVYITSDKCYWNKEWPWGYRENDELGGPDPYSASKASAEHVFKSYDLSFFKDRKNFGCGSVRAGNVIGGGDRSQDRIVPDIIRSIERNEPIILRYPNATRPWQHVLDPLNGYLCLAALLYQEDNKIKSGESWNFGPSTHSIRTVWDLVTMLTSLSGGNKIEIETPSIKMHEATLLHLSIEKAMNFLNWSPKYTFDQTVTKTGEWYTRIRQGESASEVTKEQIIEFMGA